MGDSTGRYCVTYSSAYEHNMENGYNMGNFQGKDLYEEKMDKLKKVSWRPRPKSVLSDNQLKEIQKNIKEYARQFQQSDDEKEVETTTIISRKEETVGRQPGR